ncbi:hypothetical protein PRIC1_010298 [Phytophthora ramorum]
MVSVRQVASSLLGQSVQRSQSATHRLERLSPPLAACLQTESRSFSSSAAKRPRKHGQTFVKPSSMDLPMALKRLQEIQASDAVKLTKNDASTLVDALVKHKKHDECVQLLRSLQKQNVPLKPFARLSGFSILCLKKEFKLALKEFESLRDAEVKLTPWVFAAALDAATKLNRQETVRDIFKRLVTKGEERVEVSGQGVVDTVKSVRERGVKLPEFALRVLVSYADKSHQPEMALEVLSIMQDKGISPAVDVYASVFVACGTDKRWSDVLKVFDAMPQQLLPQLNDVSLGHVVMAHTHSKSEELTQRGLDIFGRHKEKRSKFACSAALEALLETRQFEVLFALASEMTRRGMKWDSFTYKMVALAYIRDGSIEKARQFLHANTKHMNNDSALCYREIIDHYANTSGDVEQACQLYLEMIENKLPLNVSDWCNALELALQLSDRTVYWGIRNQLGQRNQSFEDELPVHLVLSSSEDAQHQVRGLEASTPAVYSDVALAMKSFRAIQQADGAGLTINVASTLLVTMAENYRTGACVEMWHYFEEQGVLPKPFACVAAFGALANAKKYSHALDVFKTMVNGDSTPSTWVYMKAFNAAINLRRHSFVTDTLRHIRENGVSLTVNEYVKIIATCTQAKEWVLATSVLASMQSQGLKPVVSIYNSLLAGCGKENYWNMVIALYNIMPSDLRPLLQGGALGSVLMAHSRADSDEMKQRTADICKNHFATCKPFPFEVAMMALLESKHFADVLSVAADATSEGFEWTPMMYRSVVMANVHNGSMEQAKQLLQEHVLRLTNISVECHRELIRYYSKVRGDVLEASKLSVQMMHNNTDVSVDDWRTALELALQLPDHAIYWDLRRWLRLHGGAALSELPDHLFLPEEAVQTATTD